METKVDHMEKVNFSVNNKKPKKNEWPDMTGLDISKLFSEGNRLKDISKRFSVSDLQIIRKLTRG